MNATQASAQTQHVPIRYVAGVSWPRSGHHLLVRLMTDYFGDDFNYCEFYSKNIECCRQFPCSRQNSISFSKNHDFKLDVSSDEDIPYIVQFRNYYNSAVSDFELQVRNIGLEFDTKEQFEKQSMAKAHQYKKFQNKWMKKTLASNILLVPYESLVSETESMAKQCIEHFSPGAEVDMDRLRIVANNVDGEKVVNKQIVKLTKSGVHKSRDYREFRYYDDKWFEAISNILN